MDWLDWVFDTVAEVDSDPSMYSDAAAIYADAGTGAFDMAGSEGYGGTTPLEITPVDMETPDTPPLSPTPAPQPVAIAAPAPTPAPTVTTALPEQGIARPEAPRIAEAPAQSTGRAPVTDRSTRAPPGSLNASASWFANLSPGAQAVLAGGVAGGAGAVMQSLAQKNAQEDQKEREDRMREDRTRRGAVAAFQDGAYKPKTGIIDSKRSGA